MNGQAKEKKPSTRLRRVGKVLYIALFCVALVVVAGYVAMRLLAPAPTVETEVRLPIGPIGSIGFNGPLDLNDPDVSLSPEDYITLHRKEGVYTCLMLGVADLGGSDTLMLGVFDTKNKTASLISIPRDTAVVYEGRKVKINATYSYGGREATQAAISGMLGVPIDFCVSVNLKAFEAIVDEIGGVWFNVPVDMNYSDPKAGLYINVKAGYQLLNGKDAVGVVRCRSCYANADIGRTATQRAFLSALVKQTVTLSNATRVTELINILNTYVDSDMPLNNMVFFGTQAVGMDLDTNLNSAALSGVWPSVRDPYYYLYAEETLELVNGLGIYEEELPMEALNLVKR